MRGILTFLGLWGASLLLLAMFIYIFSPETHESPITHTPHTELPPSSETTPLPQDSEVATTIPTYTSDTQFIAFSFDGSRSLSLWKETLKFAEELRAEGIPIAFTYFISGVYLIPAEQKQLYQLSWLPPGESAIAYGDSVAETDQRITYINTAYHAGHAIGSHLNGHFDGSQWTEAQWCEEMQAFEDILYDHLSEPLHRGVQLAVPRAAVIGMRTPSLSHNEALFTCLSQHGYQYDASLTGNIGGTREFVSSGILEFPLVSIPFRKRSVLSMDYNLYMTQTKGVDILKKGTPEWESAKSEVFDAYMKYFELEYNGARTPMNIGNHFSSWNGGVYLSALEDFARTVCRQPDVACVNYNTLNGEMRMRANPLTP